MLGNTGWDILKRTRVATGTGYLFGFAVKPGSFHPTLITWSALS
jgi:hypothetical protein